MDNSLEELFDQMLNQKVLPLISGVVFFKPDYIKSELLVNKGVADALHDLLGLDPKEIETLAKKHLSEPLKNMSEELGEIADRLATEMETGKEN